MGNELGAGSAAGARLAMDTAAAAAPALWLAAAAVLGVPPAQRALVGLFTAGGDAALLEQLRRLLMVVLTMLLFDGIQTVLQGVVQARPAVLVHFDLLLPAVPGNRLFCMGSCSTLPRLNAQCTAGR